MTVLDLIRTQRATRQYTDEPVSDEAIRTILQAGREEQARPARKTGRKPLDEIVRWEHW